MILEDELVIHNFPGVVKLSDWESITATFQDNKILFNLHLGESKTSELQFRT